MGEMTQVVREVAIPPCPDCDGTGRTLEVCHVCSGEGTMWIWGQPERTCIECDGSCIQPCWSCGGTGAAPVRLRNMTPHPVTIVIVPGPEGRSITIPPDPEGPARCTPTTEVVGEVQVQAPDGGTDIIPIRRTVMGEVVGLPDPEPGVLLIVSRVVAEAARDRRDLVIVDDTVRDDQGRIVGARALAVMP